MNWSRVPIVRVAINIAAGLMIATNAVFVEFPLYLVGYKKCDICGKRISPKDEMETTKYNYHGFEDIKHYCKKCNDRMYQSSNTKED